jgi:hypothetical protein
VKASDRQPTAGQREREANQAKWRQEIDAWRTSGKALSVWARERNLSRDALRYWKDKLPELAAPGDKPNQLSLIPVRMENARPNALLPASEPGAAIDVVVGNCRIHVRPGFDPAHLRAMIGVLATC